MKKMIVAPLVCMLLMCAVGAFFVQKYEYTSGMFSDVAETDWYATCVEQVYTLGLMNGTGQTSFEPHSPVTVAQIITLTARARAIHDGETITDEATEPWYAPYVSYAIQKGYVSDGEYTEQALEAPAKRHEVATLLRRSMPEGYYSPINRVQSIPDVAADAPYYADVLTLYKAGILTGSDAEGTFYPDNNIIRAEVAAMITRVALPEERVRKTTEAGLDAYTLIETDDLHGAFESVNSGWQLDNRGGIPRSAMSTAGDFTVTDMKTDAGTALIRHFNTISEGRLVLETRVTLSGQSTDGVYLEYQTSDGRSLYHIETVEGVWKYTCADGQRKTLYTPKEKEAVFTFSITVDLEKGSSTTFINTVDCGTYPLAQNEQIDIQSFRYGSTEQSTATYAVANKVRLNANYRVSDDFYFDTTGAFPFGYTGQKAQVSDKKLCVESGGYAQKGFEAIGGIAIAEAEWLMKDGMVVELAGTNASLVTLTVKEGRVYANDAEIYAYHSDIWYRLRVELDTQAGTAVIKLNGRKVGDAAFTPSPLERIAFSYAGEGQAEYDTVRVFEKVLHDDYVPAPVTPVGEEKYTVGVNVCSLWKNGHHYGWAPITPYEEPVLGYYDEGNPETADWEIKYMVEHGIDFQSFCWFPDQKNAPLKDLECRYQLHDAYMNAEYSDRMKYCLIWECANAKTPAGMQAWMTYYVPYLIENYFKDTRYMTIDNRLVFCVFGAGKLNEAGAFGSWEKTKEAFDYLEKQVQALGFDGMLYLALGTSNETLALMGFDASYAYSWSRNGYDVEHNKNSMLASLRSTDTMYTVPTVSVGFNDIAWWGGKRYPLMTVEDYRTVNRWVLEQYLPQYGKGEAWKENFVMLSTWNEYGEGTYIMPAKNNGGFGYLDALRECYTDEKADASLNIVPTEEQKKRITRLYPQEHSMLKYQGYYDPSADDSLYKSFYSLEPGCSEEVGVSLVENYEQTERAFVGTTGKDASLIFKKLTPIDLGSISKVKLRLKVPAGNLIEVFFTTDKDMVWDPTKSFKVTSTTNEMTDYVFETSGNPLWKNSLTQLRIDPAWKEGVPFELEGIYFLSEPVKKTFTVTVDGEDVYMGYPSAVSPTGDYLVPVDTVKAPELMACLVTWNKQAQSLTIASAQNTVVFTVGKDSYLVNDKEMALGYTIQTLDGLPMLPLEKLCTALGYSFREEAEEVFVETSRKAYFDCIHARKPGQWEFDLEGDTEQWVSSFMSLTTENGYLHLQSVTDSKDPTLLSGTGLKLTAEKYDRLELRCRYAYESERPTRIAMFFLTDTDTTWNEEKCIRQLHTSTDTNGEWVTYTFDLKEVAAWKDTITRLRFDPFDAVGTMDIDYIRFIEDEGWVDPALRPFEIRNGDAADAENVTFESQNGTVSIQSEKENTFYMVRSNPGKQWLYLYQTVTYKPGRLYTFEYDVKLCDTEINTMLSNDTTVYINCNVQYNDPGSKTDHVVLSTPVKISDGWVHCQGKFIVSDASQTRGLDKFSIYSNPLTEDGIAFCLDNVVVTEVEA